MTARNESRTIKSTHFKQFSLKAKSILLLRNLCYDKIN